MPHEEVGASTPAANHLSAEWESRGRKRSSILDWLKGGTSPGHSVPSALGPSPVTGAANANTNDTDPRPSKLDALFRPDRTYLSLSRNRFVLLVVLPAVTVVLIILPVALGVGLSRERKRDDDPMPSRTAR